MPQEDVPKYVSFQTSIRIIIHPKWTNHIKRELFYGIVTAVGVKFG